MHYSHHTRRLFLRFLEWNNSRLTEDNTTEIVLGVFLALLAVANVAMCACAYKTGFIGTKRETPSPGPSQVLYPNPPAPINSNTDNELALIK